MIFTKGDSIMLALYKNIKKRRLELGLTQTDVAVRMGYADKSMIAKIEKGLVDIPQSKIILFAEILRTSPSDLMGLDGVETDTGHCMSVFESSLLESFQRLNVSGQKKVIEYISDLLDNEKYTKK